MATTYQVYLGASGDPLKPSGGPISELTWTPNPLGYAVVYQWRVDAVNEFGATEGDVWSFTTISFKPPVSSWRLLPGGSGSGPLDDPPGVAGVDYEWTSVNNMRTTHRLVAAANNKVWID